MSKKNFVMAMINIVLAPTNMPKNDFALQRELKDANVLSKSSALPSGRKGINAQP